MLKRPDARTLLFEKIRTSPPKFVHVTGVPYTVEHEVADDPANADHVYITLEAPPFGRLRAAVNTLSRLNREAGADARVRVGIVKSTWVEKPTPGLVEERGQDYAKIEATENVTYAELEPESLGALLIENAKKAVRVEIWGDLYARDHLGIHQLHSRRASCAVPMDIKGRDGALKFYYPEGNTAELFLFKFCGQP